MNIDRKIYFYRVFFKSNGQLVDPQAVFSHINSLPFDENGRYLQIEDGNMRSMFVDSITAPLRIRMGTKRIRGLPIIESRGQISPLSIPIDSGLYEPMHVVFFPNNVAGFESNFYGPRPTSLRYYIMSKASSIIDDVEMIPLIRSDILQLLSRMGEIRTFRMKVHRDMDKYLRELNDNLPGALAALKRTTDAEYIEIIFRCDRGSKSGISLPFRKILPKWLSKPDIRDGVDNLTIRARDEISGEIEEFDLLQQYLLSKKQVVTHDDVSRSVNTSAMYSAINEAYTELRSEINLIVNERHQRNGK